MEKKKKKAESRQRMRKRKKGPRSSLLLRVKIQKKDRERERCVGGKRDVIEVVGRQNPSLIHHETDASGHSRSQAQSINT